MKQHENKNCPIDIVKFGADLFADGVLHSGAELSDADYQAGRRIAREYLEQLREAEQLMDQNVLIRVVDQGRAHLTREYR